MYAQVEKAKENKSRATANSVTQKKNNEKQSFGFEDNRTETVVQRRPYCLKNENAISTNAIHSIETHNQKQPVIQCLTKEQICNELVNWDCINSGMQMSIEDTAIVILMDPKMIKTQNIEYLRKWLNNVGYKLNESRQHLPLDHTVRLAPQDEPRTDEVTRKLSVKSESSPEIRFCEVSDTFMTVRFTQCQTYQIREIKASLLDMGFGQWLKHRPRYLTVYFCQP